jgi:hypothetical protein
MHQLCSSSLLRECHLSCPHILLTIIFACLSWLSIAPERWRTRLLSVLQFEHNTFEPYPSSLNTVPHSTWILLSSDGWTDRQKNMLTSINHLKQQISTIKYRWIITFIWIFRSAPTKMLKILFIVVECNESSCSHSKSSSFSKYDQVEW